MDGGAKRAVGATNEERDEGAEDGGGEEGGVKISAGRTGEGMMYAREGTWGVVGGAGDATGGINAGAAGSRRRRRPRRVAGRFAVAARYASMAAGPSGRARSRASGTHSSYAGS